MIRELLKRISVKDSYSQNTVLILLSKSLIIVLTFFTTPIIARFYAPEDYGTYALLNSIVVFVSLLSSWSLSSEIVICKEKELKSLINFIIQLSLSLTLIFTFILIAIKDYIFINIKFNGWYLVVIPILVLLINITQVFAVLNIRDKQFKKNIVVNTSDLSTTKISSLILGLFKFTSFGLIIGDIAGKTINVITQTYMRRTAINNLFSTKNIFQLDEIASQLKKYKNYWKYQMPSILTQSISSQVLVWLLAIFFSTGELGYYSMAVGLVAIPLNLFSNSFQPIITRKLTEGRQSKNKLVFFDKAVLFLFLISLLVYSAILLVCDWFIPLYLGDNWTESIKFVKILCILYSANLIGNSLSGLYVVFHQQKLNFIVRFVVTILIFTALTIYFNFQNTLMTAIIIYVILGALGEVVRIYLLRKKIIDYE